jgi:hypothetical protein
MIIFVISIHAPHVSHFDDLNGDTCNILLGMLVYLPIKS